MKPRVLIVIDTYAIGGPGKLILQFLRDGGKDISSPIVAGFWRGPERAWQFRDAVEVGGTEFAVLRQTFAFDPLVIGAARRLARDKGIQILESHGYKSHVVCLALKLMLGLPWIAYVHGWTSENFKVEMYNRLDRWIVRFADRIVPVSRDLGARLRLGRRDLKKLVYIPNAVVTGSPKDDDGGVGDVRSLLGARAGDPVLGVVGRLSPEKGHRYFIEAMNAVSAEHKDVRAVLVGEGQERAALTRSVREAGLEDRVYFAGYREDVSPWYRACDVVVMPSLREGMPLAALEAMAFAKPVIASNVGGIPEVVLDGVTGLLVHPADPSALAGAISGMLKDPALMERLGRAGRQRVEAEFSPSARTDRIKELYEDLPAR